MPFSVKDGMVADIMINPHCFPEYTFITTSCGLSKKIIDFPNRGGSRIFGWKKGLKNSIQLEMECKGIQNIIQLTLEDGRNIRCTKDHKFLLDDDKWEEAENLYGKTIMMGIEGIEDFPQIDEKNWPNLECNEFTFTMDNSFERDKTLAFARLLGYIFICGIPKINYERFTGISVPVDNLFDLEIILQDIQLIIGSRPLNPYIIYPKFYTNEIPKDLFDCIRNIIYKDLSPIQIQIPEFILEENCPNSIIREFIATIFGSKCNAPFIQFDTIGGLEFTVTCSIDQFKIYLENMETICHLLGKLEIRNVFTECRKLENPIKMGYEIRIRITDCYLFARKIGFRYSIDKISKLSAALSFWRYKENNGDLDASSYLKQIDCDSWFSCKKCESTIRSFKLKVIQIIEIGQEKVYDLSIFHTESFLAFGAIVHNCKPSRMTIGMIIELLQGKIGCTVGKFFDATVFEDCDENEETLQKKLEAILPTIGYPKGGQEKFMNGRTGEMFESPFFIGTCFYQKLKHMVDDKIHSRSRGPVHIMTRQPVDGRSRDGGLRFGKFLYRKILIRNR